MEPFVLVGAVSEKDEQLQRPVVSAMPIQQITSFNYFGDFLKKMIVCLAVFSDSLMSPLAG